MIPRTLLQVCDYLRQQELRLAIAGQDPRLDSAQAGARVVQAIQNANQWVVEAPNLARNNNRCWYDARIDRLYVKVKISTCSSPDNTNAKHAVYWLLTGQDPTVSRRSTNNRFFRNMRDSEDPDETRDFYYVIVNKSDTSDIFIVSLKGIATCYPAHNNLPFQAKWDECRTPVRRTWTQARDFLLGIYATSIRNLIASHQEGMPGSYPEFFNRS